MREKRRGACCLNGGHTVNTQHCLATPLTLITVAESDLPYRVQRFAHVGDVVISQGGAPLEIDGLHLGADPFLS